MELTTFFGEGILIALALSCFFWMYSKIVEYVSLEHASRLRAFCGMCILIALLCFVFWGYAKIFEYVLSVKLIF